MRIRVELSLHMLGLRLAVILLGLGAVALFDRMSPAIERILAENVVTLQATEQMLVALSDPALEPEEGRSRFDRGLVIAKNNVTEPAENALLAELERLAPRAFADTGGAARARVIQKVLALAEVNRRSMQQQDAVARRLGLAGGWAAVIVALLILGITVVLTRRLESQVVAPLAALAAQADKIRGGDVYLRCAETGAPEIKEVAQLLNQLLDDQHTPPPPPRLARADRKLVLYFLDQLPGAWLATDNEGEVVACNQRALLQIQERGHPPATELKTLQTSAHKPTCIDDGDLWLVQWTQT